MAIPTRTVLITGASSGIGRSTVSRMVESGWTVFASVRKEQDGAQLRSDFGARVTPIIMDVTDRRSITTAAEWDTALLGGSGLDGLINVAGQVSPVEYMSHDDLEEIFDINVFGQIAVTRAFLPALRKARGRIVNVTSIGAHIAIPFGSLINASKSAFAIANAENWSARAIPCSWQFVRPELFGGHVIVGDRSSPWFNRRSPHARGLSESGV